MNSRLVASLAAAFSLAALAMAGDAPVNTVPTRGFDSGAGGGRKATPMLRDEQGLSGNKGGYGRVFEARGGARFSGAFGTLRPGRDGSSELDFRDDLGLSEVEVGPQIDLEWQISPRSHFQISYAHNDFGSRFTTSRAYQYQGLFATQQNPVVLPAGSGVNTKMDVDLLWGHFRYDLVREGPLTFSPLVGFKAAFIETRTDISSSQPGISPFTTWTNVDEATPLFGFDLRLQFTRWCYFGLEPYGFAFDRWAYMGGQGYFQFDFNPDFGLRVGLDVDYVTARRGGSDDFALNAGVASAFIQLAYGF
jgi:hypothetical protein